MSVLFLDSFDHYTSLSQKWDTALYAEILDTAGRYGTAGLHLYYGSGSSQGYVEKAFSNTTEFTVGFAWTPHNLKSWSVSNQIAEFRVPGAQGASQRVALNLRSDGLIGVTIGPNAVSSILSIYPVDTNKTYYLEFFSFCDSANGSVKLLMDGIPWIDSQGLNTDNLSLGYFSVVRLSAAGEPYIDDVCVCDDLVGLSDVRVVRLMPNGDSVYSEWTPSTGSTHYSLVNESPPVTTTYVSTIAGVVRDMYTFDDFEHSTGTASAVQLSYLTAMAVSGTITCRGSVRRDTDESYTSTFTVTNTTPIYRTKIVELDPFTEAEWAIADVNSTNFGIESQ